MSAPTADPRPQTDAEQLKAFQAINPSVLARVLYELVCDFIPDADYRRTAILAKYDELRRIL